MNENIPRSNNKILTDLLKGLPITSEEHISLKKALGSVFFKEKGFMFWARSKKKKEMKTAIAEYKELLIQDENILPDNIVDNFATRANQYNQGWQLELFYELHKLILDFEGSKLESDDKKLLSIIQEALRSTNDAKKAKAITLVAMFGEMSNSQSRKSTAGIAAEDAIELVLRSISLVSGETYGAQFKHYKGSDTDFVVFDKDDEVNAIKAYIAVQCSTNDRLRLSSSELQDGGKRYICSLNGCGASSKTTKDIGNALIGGQSAYDTYYVVIESERIEAIKDAKKQVEKAKDNGDSIAEGRADTRLQWLEKYAINYNEFANQITEVMVK